MEDSRVCRGNYDSAMHYDCAECLARCKYRKDTKPVLVFCTIMVVVIIVTLALIFF